ARSGRDRRARRRRADARGPRAPARRAAPDLRFARADQAQEADRVRARRGRGPVVHRGGGAGRRGRRCGQAARAARPARAGGDDGARGTESGMTSEQSKKIADRLDGLVSTLASSRAPLDDMTRARVAAKLQASLSAPVSTRGRTARWRWAAVAAAAGVIAVIG